MSLTGIDTTGLVGKFTTSESQREWADVEEALQKAFPDQSMEELHAEATALLLQMPDLSMEDLVEILAENFGVEISNKVAAEIRTEWDEFNAASGLDAAELMAVLDDYSGDKVDTKSQKYLMFLMQALRKELDILAGESEEVELEADKEMTEADKADYITEAEKQAEARHKSNNWLAAALTIAGTVVAAAAAMALGPAGIAIMGPGVLTMAMFAASSVASAATGEDYSLATVCSEILQALGVDPGTAKTIGTIYEVLGTIQAVALTGGVGILAQSGRGLDLGSDIMAWLTEKLMGADTGETDKTEGTGQTGQTQTPEQTLSSSDLTSLKEAVEQMAKLLKSGQDVNAQMLDAIFNAMRDAMSGEGKEYVNDFMGLGGAVPV